MSTSKHEPAQTQALMPPERLAEIKNLLRYESSISFHSARAKESMLLLVAEIERLTAERAEVLAEVSDRLAARATLYGDSRTVNEVIRDLRNLGARQTTGGAR